MTFCHCHLGFLDSLPCYQLCSHELNTGCQLIVEWEIVLPLPYSGWFRHFLYRLNRNPLLQVRGEPSIYQSESGVQRFNVQYLDIKLQIIKYGTLAKFLIVINKDFVQFLQVDIWPVIHISLSKLVRWFSGYK